MAPLRFAFFGVMFVLMAVECETFDINDPKTNLDYFVRTAGSKNSSVSTLTYFNGSVYHFQPGQPLQTIMGFEGYNINRKIPQPNGSYLSLSLEFVVYRDPLTSNILQIWMNPYSREPNEVFYVANNPVNGMLELGNIFPTVMIPNGDVVFNADIVLEYPNALDPAKYTKYSAGSVYDAVELFAYFSNVTLLSTVPNISVGNTGTWMRKSQYLPWMEMGQSKGCLYFTTLVWTCPNGLGCVAADILEIVRKFYPEFTDAPKTFEEPNETSWVQFKRKIDQRRKAGLPDILLPQVNIKPNLRPQGAYVDERILNLFDTVKNIKVYFNGSVYSEIVGKDSLTLFNIEGNAHISVTVPKTTDSYQVFVEIQGSYKDPKTGNVLQTWRNPITGSMDRVPGLTFNNLIDFEKSMVYSLDIPTRKSIGLIAAQSITNSVGVGQESWSVNLLNVLFHNKDIERPPMATFFTGTFSQFGSWFDWMNMNETPGNTVLKATMYRVFL